MKHTSLFAVMTAAVGALALSNCTQMQEKPVDFSADFGKTGDLPIATSDCKVVCARAEGKSKGFDLLGFIPIKSTSETAAIRDMYNNARARGAQPEGEARFFVNKSIEKGGNNYILFSRPTITASGDLVQYMSDKPVAFSVGQPEEKKSEDKGMLKNMLPL